jgi:ATP-dependent Lon protease
MSSKDSRDSRLNKLLRKKRKLQGGKNNVELDENEQDELDGYNELKDKIRRTDSLDEFIVDDSYDKYSASAKLHPKQKEEFLNLRDELDEEVPTIEKIMNANITKGDKKMCLRLFDQFNNADPYSDIYFRLIDSINEILFKAKAYTKSEVAFLEKEEEKLKEIYVSKDTLKTKILKLEASIDIKARLLSMYDEMMSYPNDSTTHTSLREEIEWSIRLPYEKREVDAWVTMDAVKLNSFYCQIRKQLDEELYGMEKVKERILHVLNDRRSSGDACGRNIALVGPPGCGKTEICKVLAKVLNKKFAKISAGALDSAAIKGTNRVWIGAEPSIVLQTLGDLKTNNAVIMIDEIDKLGETPQGKLAQNAFLHISDPADNGEFQDNYLKHFSHDLSKVLFIYCMNKSDCLDPALLDRLDIIEVNEYTNDEKLQIFKNYMLPKALINLGMNKKDVVVSDAAIKKLLEEKNIGLRSISKIIKNLIGKVNMYKNVLLPDGTIGKLSLPYTIPNFKIPLKIDYPLLKSLIK